MKKYLSSYSTMNLMIIISLLIVTLCPKLYGLEGDKKNMSKEDTTYNKIQYDLLKKCSKNKNTTEWNDWRKKNSEEKITLIGVDLSSFELIDANLENADLSGAKLFNTNLSNANLKGANLEEAYLVETILNSAVLTKVTFKSAALVRVKANNSNFDYADFKNADIKMSDIENCTFVGADFSYANIWDEYSGPKRREIIFRKCDLKDSTFIETTAKNVDFRYSDFSNVTFNNADLSQSNLWYAKFNVDEIKKAKRLFHTKFLLGDYNDYLLLKEKDILFCYEEQYKRLLKCSEKKDLSEWNNWNPHIGYEYTGKRIYLAGADLENLFLEKARLVNADLRGAIFMQTNLKEAILDNANLEEAYMNGGPCFDHASLHGANLKDAFLGYATFRNAILFAVNLENTEISPADFTEADMRRSNLKNSKCNAVNFYKSNFWEAHLEGANLYKCDIRSVNFQRATTDSTTVFYQCNVDFDTDFRCVLLDGVGIDFTTKRILEYNMRRKNWSDWYWLTPEKNAKKIYVKGDSLKIVLGKVRRQIATSPIRLFWYFSNYGSSPKKLILLFVTILFSCALLYWQDPGCIENLVVKKGVSPEKPSRGKLLARSVIFSALTMTTLGFGDMYPAPDRTKGYVLVLFQVISSYFILGVLISYLGILLTSGGPFLTYAYPMKDIFP
jgi:uncharacterized protein YjbI with pentapeptide repeats